MKFKNYLEQINGVEIYPMISLILFGLIFLGVVFYAFTADKKKMNRDASIPLDDSLAKTYDSTASTPTV